MVVNFECDIVTLVFSNNILNICIRFILFNTTYIIPICFHTTLLCDSTIGTTLRYLKCYIIWVLYLKSALLMRMTLSLSLYLWSTILLFFADVIYNILRLISLPYRFPIHLMFNQYNFYRTNANWPVL